MTDLTRERLATPEMVAAADDAYHAAATHTDSLGQIEAAINAALALSPASGGVSGEDGRIKAFLADNAGVEDWTPFIVGPGREALVTIGDLRALLAERDGLRAQGVPEITLMVRDEMRNQQARAQIAEAALSASNAALADALGLLREPQLQLCNGSDSELFPALLIMQITAEGEGLETGGEADWIDRRDAFLAKHGPSP